MRVRAETVRWRHICAGLKFLFADAIDEKYLRHYNIINIFHALQTYLTRYSFDYYAKSHVVYRPIRR